MELTLLKRLVETNSHSANKEGLAATRQILEGAFDVLGAKKSVYQGSLLYTQRPKAPVQLFLGGHFDTVHRQEGPFQKLTKVSGGRLIGPGVADMKGGLVILLKALKEFEKSPFKSQVGWRLVLNCDEEIGSPTSTPLIEKAAEGCRAAFFFEPSLPGGELVSSRKGSLNVLLTSKGKSAHAGRDLAAGKNALVPLAELIVAFKKLAGINFAQISGGSAFNVVPDRAELKINLRSEKSRDFKMFFEKLEHFAENRALTWEILSFRPPKPLTQGLRNLLAALDYPKEALPSGGVCDGNTTARLGIPTVDTLGAVGGHLHTSEEYIELKSLQERSDLFLQFLVRVAKGEIILC